MPFHFYQPVTVRYSDLDPQGHANNAVYLTYFEEARAGYVRHLGLWKGESFLDLGIIIAEAQVSFKAPVEYGVSIRVGVRTSRIGNKSFQMDYSIEDANGGKVYAEGSTTVVAFDYRAGKSVPVPEEWRRIISELDGLDESGSQTH